MEKSFESQSNLHTLLDEGLEAMATNEGRSADAVFADIEKHFENFSSADKKRTS